MKRKSILCLGLCVAMVLSGGAAMATNYATAAMENIEKEFLDRSFLEEISIDRPGILDSSIFFPFRPEEEEEELPSHYCMRDDYILYAQHQDKEGYCWNFAATMSASTTLMKATGEYYDFSESWNGLSSLYVNGGYNKIGSGGDFNYQRNAMQYGGLMLESDFPYQNTYTISSENADDYYEFYKQYANNDLAESLTSTKFTRSDVEEIKKHVYNHGSVYAAFTFRTGYVPDENGIYALPPNQTNTNSAHAVSIIGWDDNYQREFYLDGSDTPTVFKGAWLILNSFTETNGRDGISFVFYDDTNLYGINGYTYNRKSSGFYFYDKIEKGYAYPTNVKGKYCGDFIAQEGVTQQKNIFYDDVTLEYSYAVSKGTSIKDISIYLDNVDVTDNFEISIDAKKKRFYISKEDAAYGQYKVLVSYGNNVETATYLNNFVVTYGLFGEKLELNTEKNNLAFNSGRDLEYHSIIRGNKDYVIYTNQRSGTLEFLPINQSVYSDKNMSIPTLSYEITDGGCDTVTHTITSTSGYALNYNFHVEYYEDTSLQPVNVFYDLGGGINHPKNYDKELANATTDLTLYAPTKEGYIFTGWYVGEGENAERLIKSGDAYNLAWDKIHHMGETPTLHALSYYQKYYNNTNVVFVHASWEKAEEFEVKTEVVGSGSVHSSDQLTYTFAPDVGYQVKDVKVDGISVGAVSNYTFIDAVGSHTITVEYEVETLDVQLSVQGKGNATSSQALSGVVFGESRVVELSAEKGWEIAGVYVNGAQVSVTNNQLILDNITQDMDVLIVYEQPESHVGYIVAICAVSFVAAASISLLVVYYIKMRKKEMLEP